MYRILIVDDEATITDSLVNLVQTSLKQVDVYPAYSAKQARAYLQRAGFDILITDIQMPGMNGIELLEKVNQLLPQCRTLFLSGPEDFDYAYQAMKLYKRAAELGEDSALLHLGKCYADGIGVNRNFDLAREALSRAERLGVEGARELITDIMNKKIKKLSRRIYSASMRLVHQNKYSEAKSLVEIACDLCSPKATYALGCFYEFGIGTKCDKKLAYEYYKKAAALNFIDTRSKYKLSVLKLFKI